MKNTKMKPQLLCSNNNNNIDLVSVYVQNRCDYEFEYNFNWDLIEGPKPWFGLLKKFFCNLTRFFLTKLN